MSEIIIKEKGEDVSFEEITEVLHSAHKSTQAQGMNFKAARQTPEETRERLKPGGTFFVALTEGQVAGVGAANPGIGGKCWYWKEELVQLDMLAVREEYKGRGIAGKIADTIEILAFAQCGLLRTDTAEKNEQVLCWYQKRGFVRVDYVSHLGTNYYSVVLAKWKDGCPYTKFRCRLFFWYRKVRCRIFVKKDGRKRWAVRVFLERGNRVPKRREDK